MYYAIVDRRDEVYPDAEYGVTGPTSDFSLVVVGVDVKNNPGENTHSDRLESQSSVRFRARGIDAPRVMPVMRLKPAPSMCPDFWKLYTSRTRQETSSLERYVVYLDVVGSCSVNHERPSKNRPEHSIL